MLHLDSSNGGVLWERKGGFIAPSDALEDPIIGSSRWSLEVYGIHPTDGGLEWIASGPSAPPGGAEYYGGFGLAFMGSRAGERQVLAWNRIGMATYSMGGEKLWDLTEDLTRFRVISPYPSPQRTEALLMVDSRGLTLRDLEDGSIRWTRAQRDRGFHLGVAMADFTADGIEDIVVGSESGIFVYSGSDGEPLRSYPIPLSPDSDGRGLAIVDLEGDGTLEIVGTGREKTAFVLRGTLPPLLWHFQADAELESMRVVEWRDGRKGTSKA
jgi:hypothetical protein